jgi:hypothetical protein
VTPQIEQALAAIPGVTTVRRFTGSDRFIVSGNINRAAFTSATRVFVASGMNYPDALGGAAVAGIQKAPLYVIPSNCIPSYVIQDIIGLGATQMTILGGPGTLTSGVEHWVRCR